MTDQTENRRTRLAAAVSEMGVLDAHHEDCPNPDMVDLQFDVPDDGRERMFGAAGFDFRRTCARILADHGFRVRVEACGPMRMNMSLLDLMSAGVPREHWHGPKKPQAFIRLVDAAGNLFHAAA